MVNFIIGRAGSGKSSTVADMISNEIKNTTREIVLLVPEQQTVVWETKMATLLPLSANLRLEITNFTRLANSVFRQYGGLAKTVIDEGSRTLLVWRAMMSVYEHLTVYNSGHEDRNVPHLMSAIDELKSSGITPADAETALIKLREQAEESTKGDLVSRLSDAVMVYAAYESILHEEYIDRGDLLSSLANSLRDHDYFRGKAVFVDSFFSLTSAEERILGHIINQADDVTLTFSCPAELGDEVQFGEVRQYMKNAAALSARCGKEINKIVLSENLRHKNAPELEAIEKYLFNYSHSLTKAEEETTPAENVKIIKCADLFDEAEAAASIIESLYREGYRNRDIAVIAGNMSSREGIIDTVLRRHGISCFMSEAGSVSSSPAVQLILSALGVAAGGWQRKNLIRLLKTGMTPVGKNVDEDDPMAPFEGDVFESYTGTWNIHGRRSYTGDDWCMNPDGYSPEISEEGHTILKWANSAKNKMIPPLERFLSVFDGVAEVKEICTRAVIFAEEYGVMSSLRKIADEYRKIGMDGDAEKTLASWDMVCEILDKMVKMLGDTRLDAARFTGLFARVASTLDVGTIPTGIDEVVLGSGSGVRFDRAKCVIVLGSVNGEFPKTATGGGEFFDSGDKISLESVGLELSSLDVDTAAAREYFMYYRCVTSPEEKLYVLVPTGDGSEPSDGAVRISKIMNSLGKNAELTFANMPLSDVLFSTAGAEYLLSRRNSPEEVEILRSLVSKRARDSVSLTAEWDKIASNRLTLGERMSLSQSRINSFVSCPFDYTCSHIMNLKPEAVAQIRTLDIGIFIHHVIEKFFAVVPTAKITAGDVSNEELYRVSDEIIRDYLREFEEGSGKAWDGRMNYLFLRLKRYVPVFLAGIIRELEQSKFVPVAHELSMGMGSGDVPPISFTTADGTEVILHGVADRVDIYEEGGVKYVRVVDYKTGSKSFSLDNVAKGLDVQLLIYLFTLWKVGIPSLGLNDLVPAGAVYFQARPTAHATEGRLSGEEAVEKTINKIERSGVYLSDENVLLAMDKELSGKYVGAKEVKGVIKGNKATALLSSAQMGELYTQLEDIITKIATQMKNGQAEAKPVKTGKSYPCEWCDNRFICKAGKSSAEEEE